MMIVIAVVHLIIFLPIIRVNRNIIPLLSVIRLVSWHSYAARVLGNHVLETEHGQIRLGHFSLVSAGTVNHIGIEAENFARGRASHNLEVYGIPIPQIARISFSVNPYNQRQTFVFTFFEDNQWEQRLRFGEQRLRGVQETVISGVPVGIDRFDLNNPRRRPGADEDIRIGFLASGYVSLADGVQIYFPQMPHGGGRMIRALYMHKDDERWVITQLHSDGFPVRLSEETEFTRYRSITFRPDWGEFIEGVLFE